MGVQQGLEARKQGAVAGRDAVAAMFAGDEDVVGSVHGVSR
jgi:hypothetical protein